MREQEIIRRLKYFLKDLSASAKPLENTEDKIAFIKALMELLIGIFRNDEFYFDEDAFIDEHLLAKFRSKMKPFVATKLHYYFSPDEMFQQSINQRLQINPAVILDGEEFLEYIQRLYNVLDAIKTNLYLTEPGKQDFTGQEQIQKLLEQKPEENIKENLKLKTHEFTRSRQALAMYYLFKSIGLIGRNEIYLTSLARLAHVLSALPYDDINNSPIYDKIKETSSLKSKRDLLEDLEFVKKHFEMVKHKEAITLLEKEISVIEKKQKFKD